MKTVFIANSLLSGRKLNNFRRNRVFELHKYNKCEVPEYNEYIISVLKEISHENPKILDFLEKINKQIPIASTSERHNKIKENKELFDKVNNLKKESKKAAEDLKKHGINLEEERIHKFKIHDTSSKVVGTKEETYGTYSKFNGLNITKEDLERPDKSSFRRMYYSAERGYKDSIPAIESAIRKKNDLEIKLERSVFKKKEIREEIQKIDRAIDRLKTSEKRYESKKEELSKFEGLNEIQRICLIKYFNIQEALAREVSKITDNFGFIEFPQYSENCYSKPVITLAVDKLKKDAKITEEELEEIYQMIDKINMKEIMYSKVNTPIDMQKRIEECKNVFSSFIEYIYMQSDHYKNLPEEDANVLKL